MRLLRQKPKVATLKVRAKLGHQWMTYEDGTPHPGPKVVDIERFNGGAKTGKRAFIGHVFDYNLAEPGVSEGGWRPTVEPQEVPDCSEYRQAIVHGDLWPGDEATAKLVASYATNQGIYPPKFDPEYGGELKELTDWLAECDAELADVKAAQTVNVKPAPAAALPVTPAKPVVLSPPVVKTEGKE